MKKSSISKNDKFHMSRTAFIILDNSIEYLRNSSLSHKEWCKNLNIDDETFNSIVRGYITKNNMFYYMGNFECNDTVIKVAKETHEQIAIDNCLKRYKIFCGVKKGKVGEVWKPLLQIKKINLFQKINN